MNEYPILVVEDSPEDFETTVRAFRKAGMSNPVRHCVDGDEALDYLFRRGSYAEAQSAPRPIIVMLDLNLPGTDGHEVLEAVKADAELRRIPIIVLTTSIDPRDVEACYSAGANTYIKKPVNFPGFLEAIGRLRDFWFQIAVLPPGAGEAA